MLIPGLVLLLVGLLLWYLLPGIIAVIGMICAIVGAVMVIIGLVQMLTARSGGL